MGFSSAVLSALDFASSESAGLAVQDRRAGLRRARGPRHRSAAHTLFLDGVYSADRDGKGRIFHPAPAPNQEDIEQLVERTSKRILHFLERRVVITLVVFAGS